MGCGHGRARASAESAPLAAQQRGPTRVLCLHGNGVNKEITQFQLATLTAELAGRDIELVFVDGPEECPPAQGIRARKGVKFYRFCHFDDQRQYEGVEEAVEFLKKLAVEHAPLHAVMGFSQGGTMSGLFAGLARAGSLPPDCQLRFAVLMGAPQFLPLEKQPSMDLLRRPGPLTLPSLHVVGEQDQHKDPYIMNTVGLYKDPEIRYHTEGHVPLPCKDPREARELAGKIVDFMRKHAE